MVSNQDDASLPRLALSLRCELEAGQSPGCPQLASSASVPSSPSIAGHQQVELLPLAASLLRPLLGPHSTALLGKRCSSHQQPVGGAQGCCQHPGDTRQPAPTTMTDAAQMPACHPHRGGTVPEINSGFGAERQSLVTGTWTQTHRHTHVDTRTGAQHTWTHKHGHRYVQTHTDTQRQACRHTDTRTWTHTQAHVREHMDTRTWTHRHVQTHMQTHRQARRHMDTDMYRHACKDTQRHA